MEHYKDESGFGSDAEKISMCNGICLNYILKLFIIVGFVENVLESNI